MPLKPTTAMRKDRAAGQSIKLQHRHFAFIAGVIRDSLPHLTKEEKAMASVIVDAFAEALAKTNPNFDRARFFTAVGLADPVIEQAAYGNDEITDHVVNHIQAHPWLGKKSD